MVGVESAVQVLILIDVRYQYFNLVQNAAGTGFYVGQILLSDAYCEIHHHAMLERSPLQYCLCM